MPSIVCNSRRIDYNLVPSNRTKSIAMRVRRDISVEVRAPNYVKAERIENFVRSKAGWIIEKQEYFKRLAIENPPKEFQNGESFPLFGRNLRLKVIGSGAAAPSVLAGLGRLCVAVLDGDRTSAKTILRGWYKLKTFSKAVSFVEKYSEHIGVKPGRVIAAEQSSRWGSCSKDNSIRLNWRLAMMPPAIIEYVVVHELCHIKIKNHSQKFWALVKSILPDFEKRRQWLRQNGSKVLLSGTWG